MDNLLGCNKSRSGFTLIELLVTITIMVVLVGVGLAGYLNFREKQQVLQIAEDIQQFFSETRRKAQINDQSACSQFVNYPKFQRATSHTIRIADDGRSLTRITACPDPVGDQVEELVRLPNSLNISPTSLSVTYLPFARQVEIYPDSESAIISISGHNVVYQFVVDISGTVGAVKQIP